MKAITLNDFGGTENFEFKEDINVPEFSELDVLVKISASGFNPIDYQMRLGGPESARLHSPVLGREFSGIVEQAGKLVKGFKKGDAVFAASGSMGSNGTYAEYIHVPAALLCHKPVHISFEEAAGIPSAYLTALQIFERLNIHKENNVLITGASGGVGLALIKLLIASGHKNIIATAGNELSTAHLINSGLSADKIINYKNEQLSELIKAVNKNNDFDFCIDLVGGKMSELCAELIKLNGIYTDVTAFGTAISRTQLFDKGTIIFNISNYAFSLYNKYDWYGNNLRRIAKMLEDGFITPPPIKIFEGLTLASVTAAHQILENNLANGHKLVMKIA